MYISHGLSTVSCIACAALVNEMHGKCCRYKWNPEKIRLIHGRLTSATICFGLRYCCALSLPIVI